MAYGPPPLFRQGVSAKARFLFFLMLSLTAMLVDGRLRELVPEGVMRRHNLVLLGLAAQARHGRLREA